MYARLCPMARVRPSASNGHNFRSWRTHEARKMSTESSFRARRRGNQGWPGWCRIRAPESNFGAQSGPFGPYPTGARRTGPPETANSEPSGGAKPRCGSEKRLENGLHKKRSEKRGATRGLPKRSPILVLLSPKHAYLRSSDGIRCTCAGMIAPVTHASPPSYK